ncbi:Uncharacterised protein [uncultured archaeon]|nr:Uncharacterised protein [uncultured archaeon]
MMAGNKKNHIVGRFSNSFELSVRPKKTVSGCAVKLQPCHFFSSKLSKNMSKWQH